MRPNLPSKAFDSGAARLRSSLIRSFQNDGSIGSLTFQAGQGHSEPAARRTSFTNNHSQSWLSILEALRCKDCH